MVLLFLQLYGEEIEYAEDIFSTPPGVGRRVSKKGKSGDSSSTSPERNRKDDVTVCNSKKDDLLKCFYFQVLTRLFFFGLRKRLFPYTPSKYSSLSKEATVFCFL